jgi:hypothetical protein
VCLRVSKFACVRRSLLACVEVCLSWKFACVCRISFRRSLPSREFSLGHGVASEVSPRHGVHRVRVCPGSRRASHQRLVHVTACIACEFALGHGVHRVQVCPGSRRASRATFALGHGVHRVRVCPGSRRASRARLRWVRLGCAVEWSEARCSSVRLNVNTWEWLVQVHVVPISVHAIVLMLPNIGAGCCACHRPTAILSTALGASQIEFSPHYGEVLASAHRGNVKVGCLGLNCLYLTVVFQHLFTLQSSFNISSPYSRLSTSLLPDLLTLDLFTLQSSFNMPLPYSRLSTSSLLPDLFTLDVYTLQSSFNMPLPYSRLSTSSLLPDLLTLDDFTLQSSFNMPLPYSRL